MIRVVDDCGECRGRGFLERGGSTAVCMSCAGRGVVQICDGCRKELINWDAERCPKCLEPDGPAPSRAADEPADARG